MIGNDNVRCPLLNLFFVYYLSADKGNAQHGVGPEFGKRKGKIACAAQQSRSNNRDSENESRHCRP